MRVVFSDHAIARCKQQNISVGRLRKELSRLPMISGKFRWISNQRCVVSMEKVGDDIARIITVTSLRKYKEKNGVYFDPS